MPKHLGSSLYHIYSIKYYKHDVGSGSKYNNGHISDGKSMSNIIKTAATFFLFIFTGSIQKNASNINDDCTEGVKVGWIFCVVVVIFYFHF